MANAVVAAFLRRQARKHDSPALAGDAAHLGTDALTSVGVLVGLILVEVTGAAAIDSVVAIGVAWRSSSPASASSAAPPGSWSTRRRRRRRWTGSRPRSRAPARRRWSATTSSAPAVAGRHRYIDMHVQFRTGTTLERAHSLAHALRDAIESELGDAEVLIHVEPEASVKDPSDPSSTEPASAAG